VVAIFDTFFDLQLSTSAPSTDGDYNPINGVDKDKVEFFRLFPERVGIAETE